MNTRTYIRFSSTVSTCRKSAAKIPAAWACRNCRQVGSERRGAGSTPAACRISQTVDRATAMPGFSSSPLDPAVPHSGFSRARRLIPGVAGGTGPAPPARVVLLRRQPAVPSRERRGRDGEHLGPTPRGTIRRARRTRPRPPLVRTRPTCRAARILMPEHQHFGRSARSPRNSTTTRPSIRQVST